MALIPRTSPRAKVVELTGEFDARPFGRGLALVGAAFGAYLLLFQPFAEWQGYWALAGAGALLAAGALMNAWQERLILDMVGGTYCYRRGWRVLGKFHEGPLISIERVIQETRQGMNMYGEPETVRITRMRFPGGDLEISGEWPLESQDDPAEILASRIGRPLERTVSGNARGPSRRLGEQLLRIAAWGGMGFVAILMLIPILGGSRPVRSRGMIPSSPSSRAQQNIDAGNRFLGQGDFRRSEMALTQAIHDSPNDPSALNQLAYAVAEQGRPSEALRIAEKALSLASNNGMIMDTVAEMHQRLKEYDIAAALYERALPLMRASQVGETHGKYGLTLLELGRRQEAINHLRTSASIPDPRWNPRARQALQDLAAGRKPSVNLSPLP